jgi:hypothetical protein
MVATRIFLCKYRVVGMGNESSLIEKGSVKLLKFANIFVPFIIPLLQQYSKDLFGDDDVAVVPTNTMGYRERMVRPGTIDILVRLASVTIKCHQSFDIYPKSLIGEVEPLIQFHTTTTESISLQEVRAAEDNTGEDTIDERTSIDDDAERTSSLMVVREQQTERTGWRVISIRPAMYEKIETWNTPS